MLKEESLRLSSGSLYIDGSPAVYTQQLTSTIRGLGSVGYVSTLPANYDANMASTINGLGSSGYKSTFNTATTFFSSFTLNSLQMFAGGYTNLFTTADNKFILDYAGTSNYPLTLSTMQSTIDGLGSAGFVSVATVGLAFGQWMNSVFTSEQWARQFELQSTVTDLLPSYVTPSALTSTSRGLGTSGYVSSISIPSENYIYRVSSFGLEGQILSTSVIDNTVYLSTIRVNLSSFATNVTGQTQMRLDFKINLQVVFPAGLTQPMQLQNYLTYEDDTTQCGPSLTYEYPVQTSSFFIQNMSFLLNATDITTTYPSTVVLHHQMVTGGADQGVFKNISPVGSCVKVIFNNI